MIIASTMPGRPEPEPTSVQIFSFLSINSYICALSIMCLSFDFSSEDWLIKLIFLFLSSIRDLNSSKSSNVSRETFRGYNTEYCNMFESIKLYA